MVKSTFNWKCLNFRPWMRCFDPLILPHLSEVNYPVFLIADICKPNSPTRTKIDSISSTVFSLENWSTPAKNTPAPIEARLFMIEYESGLARCPCLRRIIFSFL